MSSPLIVTGFHANKKNQASKLALLDVWLKNTGDYDVLIIDNNEVKPLVLPKYPRVRVIRLNANLGAWNDFWGKPYPYFCGWSVAWIMGALTAYSEQRDMIFKEQDCLWHGPCVDTLYKCFANNLDMVAQLGFCPSAPCCVESALFWVRKEYMPEMIGKYLGIGKGDGLMTVEEKLHAISIQDKRIVPITFGIGRDRPIPYKAKCWYIQKVTTKDLKELKVRGII